MNEPLPAVACACCTRLTAQPRRGLCLACYLRQHRGHTVGPACVACDCADVRVLRRHVLEGITHTLCANCSAIAGKRPITLATLKSEAA